MKNAWLMAVVALLVWNAAGCKKENKAEQLAALDNAYQSGVLTKGEYDAKRLALLGPPPAPAAAPVTPPRSIPATPPRPSTRHSSCSPFLRRNFRYCLTRSSAFQSSFNVTLGLKPG